MFRRVLAGLVFPLLLAMGASAQSAQPANAVPTLAVFDLLTISTTTMSGYSDYIQIRADGTAIQLTSDPELRAGDDVRSGRISKVALKSLGPALSAMLSPRSDDNSNVSCQAISPDAPINQITMINGDQKHEWADSSCQTAERWRALNKVIRTAISGALKPVP
jgi:hypothetical protein